MKYINLILIVYTFLFFTSCTEVVSVEVPFEGNSLVIEASLDWEKGTLGNEQTIKLSTSSPYFSSTEATNYVTGANVQVTNNNDGTVVVFEDQNNGEYITNSFVPEVNNTYTLEIVYDGDTYTAEETLLPLTETGIKSVEQSLLGGVDTEAIDVEIFFDDPEDEENYYLIIYYEHGDDFSFIDQKTDEFRNGNTISDFFEKSENFDEEPFQEGDMIDIELLSISKAYHNYIDLLINQTQTGNNPFSAIPVTLKGNCVNITTPENTPFGYFRVTASDKITYTIQ